MEDKSTPDVTKTCAVLRNDVGGVLGMGYLKRVRRPNTFRTRHSPERYSPYNSVGAVAGKRCGERASV